MSEGWRRLLLAVLVALGASVALNAAIVLSRATAGSTSHDLIQGTGLQTTLWLSGEGG